jgi:hypothetical protein
MARRDFPSHIVLPVPWRGTPEHERGGGNSEPRSTVRSQGIPLVLDLVVMLGRFFGEDEEEDDLQERGNFVEVHKAK